MTQISDYDPIANLMYGLKSADSRRQYPARLNVFFGFIGLEGTLEERAVHFLDQSKDRSWSYTNIMRFIDSLKDKSKNGEIAAGTIRNYYKAIKLFCDMNELVLIWKKISKGLPRPRNASSDRVPSKEEITRLLQYPDRRIKPIVYTMIASGIRLGAWDYLRWKHIIPYKGDNGQVISAKIIVYAGEHEEYYSFLTSEAYLALKDWMDFRASYGEKITGESWLMRDLWRTTNITYGAKLGLAKDPRKLQSSGIKRLIERALWEQGIRRPLAEGQKRHEWKAAHGFRKLFKTIAEQHMKPINVEILMGHNIGVSASYYKPKDHEVSDDYSKAVDHLTVSGLRYKDDNEMTSMKNQLSSLQSLVQGIMSSIADVDQETKNKIAKQWYKGGLYSKEKLF